MSWFTKLTGIALMAVALPTSLSAQQHQHVQRDSTRQGMMHGPMSGAMPMGGTNMGSMMEGSEMMLSMIGMSPRIMRLQPNQVLRHVEELGLSEDQIAQIEHIAEEQRDAHAGHMSSMNAPSAWADCWRTTTSVIRRSKI